jgi:hypothetical protein
MQANPNLGKRWQNQTVVIFGSGNSLTDEQIEIARKLKCSYIAINDTYKRVPFADVLYACDYKWWNLHFDEIIFNGELWTQDLKAKREFGLSWVLGRNKNGLGSDCVHFGGNSGYQAINLAYLWGAKRIILLGFDCQPLDGKSHWFGQHPQGLNQTQNFAMLIGNFNLLAKDLEQEQIEVINCSMKSALQCFKKVEIEKLQND